MHLACEGCSHYQRIINGTTKMISKQNLTRARMACERNYDKCSKVREYKEMRVMNGKD